MSFNITIFVCLLANFLLSFRVYEAGKIPNGSSTIADEIKNDEKVCNIISEIQHSKYLQECNKLKFPNEHSEVTKENVNQFLCIALYDSYVRICQYNNEKDKTKSKEMNKMISVWNNQKEFDNSIDVINKSGDDKLWEICQKIKKLSPVYNKTNAFVEKLKSKFHDRANCAASTERDSNTIEPLLIALYVINQKFDEQVINSTEKKELITKKLPANDTIIPDTDKLNTPMKPKINSPDLKENLPKSEEVMNKPIIENKPIDLHSQSHEHNEHTNDKQKQPATATITTTTTTTVMPKVPIDSKTNNNPSKKILPPIANTSTQTDEINKTTFSDITETEKKEEISNTKTTLSDKTRNEEQLDYDPQTADNDQLPEPDDDVFPGDDLSRQQPKDISQLDDDMMDQKENPVVRLSSTHQEDDSHFFGYFTVIGLVGICGCLIYHRKQKILAMIVEGRRSKGGRGRKRPSTASYRKLDSNLEEAVTSQCNSNVSHVIY